MSNLIVNTNSAYHNLKIGQVFQLIKAYRFEGVLWYRVADRFGRVRNVPSDFFL